MNKYIAQGHIECCACSSNVYIYTIYKNQSIQDYLFIVSLDYYIFIIIKLCDIYILVYFIHSSPVKSRTSKGPKQVYTRVYVRECI